MKIQRIALLATVSWDVYMAYLAAFRHDKWAIFFLILLPIAYFLGRHWE